MEGVGALLKKSQDRDQELHARFPVQAISFSQSDLRNSTSSSNASLVSLYDGAFSALPDPLKLYILSKLPAEELLEASRVCKQWLSLCSHDSIWRERFQEKYGAHLVNEIEDHKSDLHAHWRAQLLKLKRKNYFWKVLYLRCILWDPTKCGAGLKLSDSRMACQATSYALAGVAYTTRAFSRGIHRWKIKVLSYDQEHALSIGVATADSQLHKTGVFKAEGPNPTHWCLHSNGSLSRKRNAYGIAYGSESIITVTLDFSRGSKRGELTFHVDKNTFGVAFSGLRGPLSPITSLITPKHAVTIANDDPRGQPSSQSPQLLHQSSSASSQNESFLSSVFGFVSSLFKPDTPNSNRDEV